MASSFSADWGASSSSLADVLCSGAVGVVEGWASAPAPRRREDRAERTGRARGARLPERTGRPGGCSGCSKEPEDVSLPSGSMVARAWLCQDGPAALSAHRGWLSAGNQRRAPTAAGRLSLAHIWLSLAGGQTKPSGHPRRHLGRDATA